VAVGGPNLCCFHAVWVGQGCEGCNGLCREWSI
jgi:hypothetical protein